LVGRCCSFFFFFFCFSCCWKGKKASAGFATAAEERCGFCWFCHCG
jgi:hypothetical protein